MNSEGPHSSGFVHDRREEITVCVGVPGVVSGLPNRGRLLVVEADQEKARELRHMLRERPETLVCQEVLGVVNEGIVQWHHFNDSRLSGPSDLTAWKVRFPNLKQIDEEQLSGKRLGDLLGHWGPGEGGQTLGPLHLVLRQGDPIAALKGLGPWLSQLETVQLMLPWPEETIRRLESWLKEHNFCQDSHGEARWKIDPIARRDSLLNEQEKEKLAMLEANNLLRNDFELIKAEMSIFVAERAQHAAHLQEIREAKSRTRSALEQSQAESEKLKSEKLAFQEEIQQLNREKSELAQKLQAEHLAGIAANHHLNSEYKALKAQNEFLAAELAQLYAESEKTTEAHSRAHSDFEQSQAESEKLKSEMEALQEEFQQLNRTKSELEQKLQTEAAISLNSRQALKQLLPLQRYKNENGDLGPFDEDGLLLHFIEYGQHEARLETYIELNDKLMTSTKNCEEAEGKLKLLETQLGLAEQQLETLKDLFTRLARKPQSPKQKK